MIANEIMLVYLVYFVGADNAMDKLGEIVFYKRGVCYPGTHFGRELSRRTDKLIKQWIEAANAS